jgi:Uma2 family endonuclease
VAIERCLYDAEEANRIRELAMGVVRKPPAPFFSHQALVLKVAALWDTHAGPRQLGCVMVAPVDVILDREQSLIVQPDVLFVATERLSIVRNHVWGAPDLVAEILSHPAESGGRSEKLGWYRQYGVRECWLVDLYAAQVTVVDFTGSFPVERIARGVDRIWSSVLPGLELSASGIFTS